MHVRPMIVRPMIVVRLCVFGCKPVRIGARATCCFSVAASHSSPTNFKYEKLANTHRSSTQKLIHSNTCNLTCAHTQHTHSHSNAHIHTTHSYCPTCCTAALTRSFFAGSRVPVCITRLTSKPLYGVCVFCTVCVCFARLLMIQYTYKFNNLTL